MEKGATDEVPPVIGTAPKSGSTSAAPQHGVLAGRECPSHPAGLGAASRLAVGRAGLASGCGAASGLAGATSQGAKQGLAAGHASLGATSGVAAVRMGLDASSGVAGVVSQVSSAGMAVVVAHTSEAAASPASQMIDGDDDQSDLLGG